MRLCLTLLALCAYGEEAHYYDERDPKGNLFINDIMSRYHTSLSERDEKKDDVKRRTGHHSLVEGRNIRMEDGLNGLQDINPGTAPKNGAKRLGAFFKHNLATNVLGYGPSIVASHDRAETLVKYHAYNMKDGAVETYQYSKEAGRKAIDTGNRVSNKIGANKASQDMNERTQSLSEKVRDGSLKRSYFNNVLAMNKWILGEDKMAKHGMAEKLGERPGESLLQRKKDAAAKFLKENGRLPYKNEAQKAKFWGSYLSEQSKAEEPTPTYEATDGEVPWWRAGNRLP